MKKTDNTFLYTFKRLIKPISSIKRYRIQWFLWGLYDATQAVLVVQVGASIVGAIQTGKIEWVIFRSSFFLGIKLIANIADPFLEVAHDKGWFKMESNLMRQYFKKYIHLDNNKVETIGTGKMETIVSEWIENWIELNMELLINASVDVLGIVYALVVIFVSVPFWYFLLLFGLLVVSFIIMQYGYKKTEWIRNSVAETIQQIGRKKIQIIMSKFEILQNKRIWYETEKLDNLYEKAVWFWSRGNIIAEWWTAIGTFLLHTSNWIIYLIIGIGVIRGDYTLSEFVLMIGLMWIIQTYIWSIRRYIRQYHKNIIAVKQLWNTFDSIPLIQKKENMPNFINKKWNISLKKISFAYDKNKVFKDFSLDIIWWTRTAFVGQSWGGKTTLIKLLAGYISPDKWEVIVDGQKLSTIQLTDYYKHIGYLTQDPSVFDGTIYENLVYALDKEPTKKELEKVIQDAKCEFIREFKKWVHTEIGERWVRLSWWQKQRLAIAKIMLKNPTIVLLDEPTSALDSFNEEQVNIALHNLFKGKTVIVVAHRLQTVKQADRILFLEQGKIIEEWTHQELVKLGWKYKKMLDLQSWF